MILIETNKPITNDNWYLANKEFSVHKGVFILYFDMNFFFSYKRNLASIYDLHIMERYYYE